MNAARYDVDDSIAVLLYGDTVGDFKTRLLLRNLGPDTCYLADATVDTDDFPLLSGEVLNLSPARRQDLIYGICDAAETATIVTLFG